MMKYIFSILTLALFFSCKCKQFASDDKLIVHYSKGRDTMYVYDNKAGKKMCQDYFNDNCKELVVLFCCTDINGNLRSPSFQKKIWFNYIVNQ
jgi:hypothetical protein